METPAVPNKRIIVGCIIVLVVLFIASIIIIVSNASSKASKVNTPQVVPSQVPVNSNQQVMQDINPTQLPNANPLATWKIYKNSYYTFSYPTDWKAEERRLPSGAVEVRISPLNLRDPYAQNLTIFIDSLTSTPSIKEKQQVFINQGFTRSSVIIDTLQASKIIGTFPPPNKVSSQSAKTSSIQMTHIYFDHGNASYLFDFSYINTGVNTQIESNFSKIISTFKFAQ